MQKNEIYYSITIGITELKQLPGKSVLEFNNKIITIIKFTYLITQIAAVEANVRIAYFRNDALLILLRGLRESIGQLMRAKNLADMNTNLNIQTNDFPFENASQPTKFNT